MRTRGRTGGDENYHYEIGGESAMYLLPMWWGVRSLLGRGEASGRRWLSGRIQS